MAYIDYIQSGALIITLFVLIWYTIETSRLRRAAQEQNKLSVRPCITFCFLDSDKRTPILKNIGRGPAFNIFLKNIVNPELNQKISFSIIDYIEPNQTNKIVFSLFCDGPIPVFKDFGLEIFPFDNYEFEIFYQSVDDDWYVSTFSVDLKNKRIKFNSIKNFAKKDAQEFIESHIKVEENQIQGRPGCVDGPSDD